MVPGGGIAVLLGRMDVLEPEAEPSPISREKNNFFLIRKFTRSSEAACTANTQESLEDYFAGAIGARFPASGIKNGAPSLMLGAPI